MGNLKFLELNHLLKNHPHTQPYFLGTFPCDGISIKPQPLTCFISNTDLKDKPGQHWVAFFVTSKGRTFFFYSYGIAPLIREYFSFCELSADELLDYNKQQLQNTHTKTCGAPSMRFLIETCRTRNPYATLATWIGASTSLTDRTITSYMLKKAVKSSTSIKTLYSSDDSSEGEDNVDNLDFDDKNVIRTYASETEEGFELCARSDSQCRETSYNGRGTARQTRMLGTKEKH